MTDAERIAELEASRDRLARAYILLTEYSFGPKRHNAFRPFMKADKEIEAEDIDAVKEAVWAEIAELPDYEEPEDEDDEW